MGVFSVSSPSNPGYASSGIQNQKPDNKINQMTAYGKNANQDASISKDTGIKASAGGSAVVETSPYGDTVEISRQGMDKAQNMSASPNAAQARQPATAETTALTQNGQTSATNSLAQYSEYELAKMLAQGTISRSQYDMEIRRRQQMAAASGAVS